MSVIIPAALHPKDDKGPIMKKTDKNKAVQERISPWMNLQKNHFQGIGFKKRKKVDPLHHDSCRVR